MNLPTPDRLADMTIEALERIAFVCAEPLPHDRAPVDGPAFRTAHLEFSGPYHGRVTVQATDGFLRELAASLLGVDADEVDPRQQGLDALRELTNILGGSVVFDLGGTDSSFRLGLPVTGRAAPDPAPEAHTTCAVEADGGPLRLTVEAFNAAPACRD